MHCAVKKGLFLNVITLSILRAFVIGAILLILVSLNDSFIMSCLLLNRISEVQILTGVCSLHLFHMV
jgi:hypothetical protein